MIYHLLYPLHTAISAFNVFRYITFRTIYASLTAFLICFLLGPWVIRKLSHLQVGQYIRDEGPQSHQQKAGTPTMGGTLIILSVFLSTVLWGRFDQPLYLDRAHRAARLRDHRLCR
jgi:phospho-N-acetylmuramoyl-pentapeptide-transferase